MKYVTSVMKSVLSNKKVVQMRCGRKFGRGTIITSVYDYRFNNQTHIFLFVTKALWVFIVRIVFFGVQSGFIWNHWIGALET